MKEKRKKKMFVLCDEDLYKDVIKSNFLILTIA